MLLYPWYGWGVWEFSIKLLTFHLCNFFWVVSLEIHFYTCPFQNGEVGRIVQGGKIPGASFTNLRAGLGVSMENKQKTKDQIKNKQIKKPTTTLYLNNVSDQLGKKINVKANCVFFRENYCKTTWKKSIHFSTYFFEVKLAFQIYMNEFIFWCHWRKIEL